MSVEKKVEMLQVICWISQLLVCLAADYICHDRDLILGKTEDFYCTGSSYFLQQRHPQSELMAQSRAVRFLIYPQSFPLSLGMRGFPGGSEANLISLGLLMVVAPVTAARGRVVRMIVQAGRFITDPRALSSACHSSSHSPGKSFTLKSGPKKLMCAFIIQQVGDGYLC